MDNPWFSVRDSDPRVVALYSRHYSANSKKGAGVWLRRGITGPGESMLLLTRDCKALWVWAKRLRDDGQTGINCAVFRNEGSILSSMLVEAADDLAYVRWPGERHFTFVDASKIRSSNPGYCFLQAGWRKCGMSKGGLVILERMSKIGNTEGGGKWQVKLGLRN